MFIVPKEGEPEKEFLERIKKVMGLFGGKSIQEIASRVKKNSQEEEPDDNA